MTAEKKDLVIVLPCLGKLSLDLRTYYGETCRHLSVRVVEHSDVSLLTGEKSKSKKSTAVKDHMLFCYHIVFIDIILYPTSDSDFHAKTKGSLLISRDEPILNKNKTSLPVYLYD